MIRMNHQRRRLVNPIIHLSQLKLKWSTFPFIIQLYDVQHAHGYCNTVLNLSETSMVYISVFTFIQKLALASDDGPFSKEKGAIERKR